MSGFRNITNYIHHKILRRESRIPHRIPLSRFRQYTTPKVDRASIPTTAGVVKINLVDPAILITKATIKPVSMTQTEKVSPLRPPLLTRIKEFTHKAGTVLKSNMGKATAAAAAFTTAVLMPRLGSATALDKIIDFAKQEATSFSWKGILALGILFLGAAALNRFYFNPRYKARPGDPTPKRLITKLVLPLLGAGIMVGAGIYALGSLLPLIGASLPFSSSLIYPALVIGTLGIYGLLILRSWVKEIYNRSQTVRNGTATYSKKNRFFTSFLSYNAQAADIIYMGYRVTTVTSITIGVLGKMALGLVSPAIFLDIALGAGFGLLYYLGYHRGRARHNNPDNKFPTRAQTGFGSASKLAGVGALCGALMGAAGPSYLTNLIFAFALFIAEAHGFVHAWRWNTAARAVEENPPKVFSDQKIQNAAIDPDTHMITMLKAGFAGNLPEIIPALWVNIHTRQGANWEVHQINGQPPSAGSVPAFEKMYADLNILMHTNETYRSWILQADSRIAAAAASGNTAQAIEEVAALYERFARAFTEPCPDNNYTPPWHGNFGAYGFLGFDNQPLFHGTQDNIEHFPALGRRMYTLGGVFLQKKAEMLRELAAEYRHANPYFSGIPTLFKPSHAEAVIDQQREVDALHRKHNAPMQMDPFMLFTNYYPQYDITKMEKINKYNGFVRDVWTAMSLVRFNPNDQKYYPELIPTKVVKILKTEHDASIWRSHPDEQNYREARNADSGAHEDNRYKWVDRPLHTIGETHSDIFCIDDSALFAIAGNDPDFYPTAHNQNVPSLPLNKYRDVIYTNSSRLRMFGDRTGQHLDPNKNPLTPRLAPNAYHDTPQSNGSILRRWGNGMTQYVDATGHTLNHIRDPIIWMPGTLEPADNELKHLHTEDPKIVEDFTWIKANPFKPKYYFFSRTPFQSISDSEQIDFIVSDFLAVFEEDQSMPHIFMQWKIKEKRKVPYDPAIKDSKHDKILMISPAISWFLLKAKERTGKTRYYPYNLRKDSLGAVKLYTYKDRPDRDNENKTLPTWMAIDETRGAALVTPQSDPNCPYGKALRLQLEYDSQEEDQNGNVTTTHISEPLYLKYPYYLDGPHHYYTEDKEGVKKSGMADLLLYREKQGPAPLVKFTLARQNKEKQIVMRNGKRPVLNGQIIDRETWETFVAFEPYSEEEYKKADPEFQAKAPWVDKNDLVHLPPGTSIAGHTMLSFLEYRAIKKWLMKGTLYERFLPLETHIPWYDPAYIY